MKIDPYTPTHPFNLPTPETTIPKKDLIEETYKAIDKKAEKYKYETSYAYHPYNSNKYTTLRQTIDFIIA